MPTVVEREELKTKKILNVILDKREPPVARCRLLSRGIEPYHRLYLENESIEGDKACLGCGNCVDSCPVLRKEADRMIQTAQRTSFALESTVGEDCEQCYACVLACPQVDTNIKDYIVDEKVLDVIPQAGKVTALDNYFMLVAALIFGMVIGAFLVW